MLATTVEGGAQPCQVADAAEVAEKDLPLTIMRAITRAMAWRVAEFGLLSKQDRNMLVEILRCISKDRPSEGVHVRRDTLAIRLDYSLATVTRILARLEELGWILRDQVKSRIDGFQVGSIALTETAVSWLGFDLAPFKAQRRAPVIDACIDSIEEKEQSIQRQLPQAAGSVDNSNLEEKSLLPGIRLPDSLAWLVSHMTPYGVCRLMKDAREKGMRLEDVTSQCADQIRSARNGFAYVRSLLGLDRDWGFMAAEKATKIRQEAEEEQGRVELSTELAALQGKAFIGEDGLVRKVAAGFVNLFTPSEASKLLGTSLGARSIGPGFVEAVKDGRLRPWTAPEPAGSL